MARREQHRNQAQASALIPVIVQQVTENVIAQLDFVRIVEQIPIDDIAASIDIEAIVQRIDLGGVIRESTASLTMETVDAVRSQGINVDEWAARVVDKVLLRKQPRDTTSGCDDDDEGDPQRAVARGAGAARRVRVAGDRRRARRGDDLRARLRRPRRVRLPALPLHRQAVRDPPAGTGPQLRDPAS